MYKYSKVVNIILAIIPITNFIFGIIERVKAKNWLGLVLNIIGAPVFWVLDLIGVITQGKPTILV